MLTYLYPQNLKARANLWFWSLRDFGILGVIILCAVVLFVQWEFILPLSAALCFGFLTIRLEDTTVLDFIKYGVRFFISTQQIFYWR